MSNKHTPGSWYFEGGVVMPDGETYEDDGVTVYRGNDWQRGIAQLVKNPADGQLIAAAPDLVEALRMVLKQIDKPIYHEEMPFSPLLNSVQGDCASAREWIRAALAKAGVTC